MAGPSRHCRTTSANWAARDTRACGLLRGRKNLRRGRFLFAVTVRPGPADAWGRRSRVYAASLDPRLDSSEDGRRTTRSSPSGAPPRATSTSRRRSSSSARRAANVRAPGCAAAGSIRRLPARIHRKVLVPSSVFWSTDWQCDPRTAFARQPRTGTGATPSGRPHSRGSSGSISTLRRAVGYVERHNPALLEMKRVAASGELGSPTAILTERTRPAPRGIHEAGVISDLATHDLDLIPWLVDEPIATLSAQTSSPHSEHLAFVTGRLVSGVVFNTVVDWLSPTMTRRVRLVLEEGTLVADTLHSSLARLTGETAEIALAPSNPLASQVDAFCNLLQGDARAPVVSLEEGLRALSCAEAALRSAQEQRVISL